MRGCAPLSKRQAWRGRAGAWGVALFWLVVLWGATSAHAQLEDPFAAQGDWVSVEDFAAKATQKAKEVPPAPPPAQETKAEPAAPPRPISYPAPPAQAAASAAQPASEAEENTLTEAPQWTPLDEYESKAQSKPVVLGSGSDGGFTVRYSTLPSAAVRSRAASRVTSSRLDLEAKSRAARQKQEAGKEGKPETVKKADADNKACEAYADYKRRQLAEIESDRKTLAQLKQALSDLGLVDRIDLMSDSGRLLVEPKGHLAQPLPDESPKATP